MANFGEFSSSRRLSELARGLGIVIWCWLLTRKQIVFLNVEAVFELLSSSKDTFITVTLLVSFTLYYIK
jgi:hypothetical protein